MGETSPMEGEPRLSLDEELELAIDNDANLRGIVDAAQDDSVSFEKFLKIVGEWNDQHPDSLQGMYANKNFSGKNGKNLEIRRDELGHIKVRGGQYQ